MIKLIIGTLLCGVGLTLMVEGLIFAIKEEIRYSEDRIRGYIYESEARIERYIGELDERRNRMNDYDCDDIEFEYDYEDYDDDDDEKERRIDD